MDDASKLAIRDRLAVVPAPTVTWEHPPRVPHLLDYLMIVRKHQWLVLTFLLTVVTLVTIASFKAKPVYVATTRVEVDRDTQNGVQFQDFNPYDDYIDSDAYLETQTKILQSDTLALQTIRSTDLSKYSEFGGVPTAVALGQVGPASRRPAILGAFEGGLSVRRVPNSRLIEVSFEGTNPQLAAAVVNAHVENYIQSNFRSKYDAITQVSGFLSAELEELRIKVEKSEDVFFYY